MARKHWIWITITIAVLHGIVLYLITSITDDIIWSRFDGNPYQSPWDPIWIGLFLLLNLPYYVLSYLAGPLKGFSRIYFPIWIGNSLAWGLLGAWLISFLPFMKEEEFSPEPNGEQQEATM